MVALQLPTEDLETQYAADYIELYGAYMGITGIGFRGTGLYPNNGNHVEQKMEKQLEIGFML